MKISDKLAKVSDSITISMFDNGFMLDVSGRNHNEDWSSSKIMCSTVEELTALIEEASKMPRD